MMLHQTDLGNARMADRLISAERYHQRRELNTRGSPGLRLKIVVARLLVRTGARLHGQQSAVIDRVVILDQCGQAPQDLRSAA